jgi:hypothetical protein
VCRFQISHGGVCMNIRVVHSDYDLFVHYFSSLGLGCCSNPDGVGGSLSGLIASLLPRDQSLLFAQPQRSPDAAPLSSRVECEPLP